MVAKHMQCTEIWQTATQIAYRLFLCVKNPWTDK